MTPTNFNAQIKRVLDVINQKGGLATLDDIKDSIGEYNNKAGGAHELEKILVDMVEQGVLCVHLHKAGNGRVVKFYRPNNSNSSNIGSNGGNGAGYVSPSRNSAADDIKITSCFIIEQGRALLREAVKETVELLVARIKADKLIQSLVVPTITDNSTPRSAAETTKYNPYSDEPFEPEEIETYTPEPPPKYTSSAPRRRNTQTPNSPVNDNYRSF